ncbi:lipopolysaccharide biosynthesis protein [Chenggangzhangella methanolivorans]|uniref:Oligosaccharide flippase family protein n=1 Tax=Chenggangzhangella methanolivorans TaxID=1437009 RepID=A0A9E6RB34_9HYPH|nr:oligosaccharide flippase family protein [Chenggangzhangella methanolivorans]QZO01496.1 oligosaccharide flippase family protein [Chenggangzhangella methanolivorans]
MIALLRSPRFLELRRFASAFTSRFGSTFLSFLVLLVASRLLAIEEYGLYVFLFSIGSALGLIAVLGQQILVVKHYRRAAASGDPLNDAMLLFNARWLVLGCGALLTAALALFLLRAELPHPYDYLWVALLFGAAFAVSEYLQSYFRIHGSINLSLIPREIAWRIASAAGLAGAALLGVPTGGVAAMAIVTVLLGAATAYQAVHFLRDEGLDWLRKPSPAPAEWRAETGYFIANNVLNSAQAYLETIVIGALMGLDKAAFYFVAVRIAMLLTLPVTAIDTVGIPLIAERFQREDKSGAQRLIGKLSFGAFCISMFGALCLAVLAPFVLTLFNAEFARHADVLAVLCALAVSQAFFGPGSWLLMIGGGERFFLIARLVLFVLYLGLLYVMGQAFGLIGIAGAGLIFSIASNYAAARWIASVWGIDNMATAFLRPFLLGGRPGGQTTLRARLEPAE